MKRLLSELLILASGAVFAAEPFGIYGLNADWRFAKATKPIPLAQAKASVETEGAKVESPSFDDSAWETVSLPHPINAHDSFDDRAVDAGEAKLRDRLSARRNPGEIVPAMPEPIPVTAYGVLAMTRAAGLDALVAREVSLDEPVFMEQLGQGFGLVSYERDLAADECGLLNVDEVHDFGYVFLDGKYLGTLDRRHRGVKVSVPKAAGVASRREVTPGTRRLQIVVEPMGRINSSQGMEDRKGLNGRVRLGGKELKGWKARMMPIDPDREKVPGVTSTAARSRFLHRHLHLHRLFPPPPRSPPTRSST